MATILVVDDEPLILQVLVTVLGDEGYATVPAADGAAALEAMARAVPDLVLMDVMMPALDGREVVHRMRAQPRTAAIPVILMSAVATPASLPDGVTYLPKPFDLDHLLRAVADRIGRPPRCPLSAV